MKNKTNSNLWVSVAGVVFGLLVFLFLAWKLTTPASDKPVVVSLPVTKEDHAKGEGSANLTIIEYADFQCPACKAVQPIIEKITQKWGDKVKFVFRHFPLDQHKYALAASIAAESAAKQGKFFEYASALYASQEDWSTGKDTDAIFEKIAADLSLDIEKFRTDLKDPSIKTVIENDRKSGIDVKVDSTPSLFLNGVKLDKYDFETIDKKMTEIAGEQVKEDKSSSSSATGSLESDATAPANTNAQ